MLRTIRLSRAEHGRLLIHDLTFAVSAGSVTSLLGGRGAGKTTVLRMLMGVRSVSHGRILWDGHDVTPADRSRFGYLPQHAFLDPAQAALGQLVFMSRMRGLGRKEARRAVGGMLERLGLESNWGEPLQSMHSEDRKRVHLAAALVAEPAAVLLDDPFTDLSPAGVDALMGIVSDLTHRGSPVVMATQSWTGVALGSDQVVLLNRGEADHSPLARALSRLPPGRFAYEDVVDAGWLRGLPGIAVLDVAGPRALITVSGEQEYQSFLQRAAARGSMKDLRSLHWGMNSGSGWGA